MLKKHPSFHANSKQEEQLLSKIYQLGELLQEEAGFSPSVKVFIRQKLEGDQIMLDSNFAWALQFMNLYCGNNFHGQ